MTDVTDNQNPSDRLRLITEEMAHRRQQSEREFGRAIERERVRRGWTAAEAADRAGVSAKTWQRLEDGANVRGLTLGKIDQLFDLPKGTAIRIWQEGGDLQAVFDRRADGEDDISRSTSWAGAIHNKLEFTRRFVNEFVVGAPDPAEPLLWLIQVAANKLISVEHVRTAQEILELATLARRAEAQVGDHQLFGTTCLIPAAMAEGEVGIVQSFNKDLDSESVAKLAGLIHAKLAARGEDGEH